MARHTGLAQGSASSIKCRNQPRCRSEDLPSDSFLSTKCKEGYIPNMLLVLKTGTRKPSIARVADTMPEATGPTSWQLFDRWWQAYPKKIGPVLAWEAWRRIRPVPDSALLEQMLQTLAWQRRDPSWLKDRGQWIPWPANYLKGRRWEDEPFEPQSAMALRSPGPKTRTQRIEARNQETLRRFLARERGEEP
jgi:hypothetical protein